MSEFCTKRLKYYVTLINLILTFIRPIEEYITFKTLYKKQYQMNNEMDSSKNQELLKDKVFYIMGPIGSGKSTLGNCLLNKSAELTNITDSPFKTSNGATGCTLNFSKESTKDGVTVVDTKGFADLNIDMETSLKDMSSALKSVNMKVDCILFVVKEGRFTKELVTFFKEVQRNVLKCVENSILVVTGGKTKNWINDQIEKEKNEEVREALRNCNNVSYEFFLKFDDQDDDDSDREKNRSKRQKSIESLVQFINSQSFENIDLHLVPESVPKEIERKKNEGITELHQIHHITPKFAELPRF